MSAAQDSTAPARESFVSVRVALDRHDAALREARAALEAHKSRMFKVLMWQIGIGAAALVVLRVAAWIW